MYKKLLSLVLVATPFISFSSFSEPALTFPHIETVGVSSVNAKPDMAEFVVTVLATKNSATEAKDAVDSAVTAFSIRMEKLGLARDKYQTANISLQPQYSYPKDKPRQQEGYVASRKITVTVNDLNQLNPLIDGALGDGIDEINQVTLKSSQRDKFEEQARMAAIADATTKAQSIAKGFNLDLDGVWQVRYQVNNIRPIMYRSAKVMEMSADNSYQDSVMTFEDRIEVIFKVENRK
ncbi:oxidative stress defense protein [Vibrio sp. SS-MA-C1-2]|uniref:oxidative stress defense protein n=1 Tax=Vibrio sp. SS-MA-C1-2 TaxID=2908646 RepID=UPI001F39F61A|nr:oxidative stress defense protein [Vibrio sp. SS-MA-C1-2]UJF19049.1 oxidative stress defense protein [Vibrio sp. SS-MA-C1-2]